MTVSLPTGRNGRALALALLVLALAALWLLVAAPLAGWYADRTARLAEREALARRMTELANALPELQRRAASSPAAADAPSLLEGASDAIAGAALQGLVQDMAKRVGARIASLETLPATQVGAWRRIALRVSLSAPWPVLVHLLQAVQQARPRMVTDDLQVHAALVLARTANAPLDAVFTVYAFRGGAGS